MDLDNDAQGDFSFACQVLEYHPQPWDEWVTIGYLQQDRYNYATLSIGPEELPCLLSGESFGGEIYMTRATGDVLDGKPLLLGSF